MNSDRENIRNKYLSLCVIVNVLILTSSYAIIRYNVFGNVPWDQLPLFILNKVLSFSGLILITLNLTIRLFPVLLKSKQIFSNTGFIFIFIHILLSLILMSPVNFSRLYSESGLLTAFSGISLASGAIAFTFMLIYIFYKGNRSVAIILNTNGMMTILMLLPLLHLFFLGFNGWTNLQKWQGGMPPITLLSFVFYSIGYLVLLIGKRDDNSRK